MRINEHHRLADAVWHASAHHDARPAGVGPELVVIHCVSLPEGNYGTGFPLQLFTGCLDCQADVAFADLDGLEVAPHVMIDRQGVVHQLVEFDKRAWHAGLSSWRGRPRCNDFSIGIELEGCVAHGYELAQYDALNGVLAALLDQYSSLSIDAIVGHAEIAPHRKFDPGPHFAWSDVLRKLSQSL